MSELGVNFWDWILEVQDFLGILLTPSEAAEYQKVYLEMAKSV